MGDADGCDGFECAGELGVHGNDTGGLLYE